MSTARALEGMIVAEIGGRGAVAVCGSLLAQLGATVVAIEHAGFAKAAHRVHHMAGKLSLSPDANRAEDRAMIEGLAARSDIVLTSGDVDPAWLRPPEMPHNVVCDITAFGRTGPMAGAALSELGVQAISGIMDTTGFPDGPPVPSRVPVVDVMGGTYAAAAALAAHRVRRIDGVGQIADIALFDGAFMALRSFLSSVLTGEEIDKSRLGNRHPTVAPWNLYRSRDGYVLICAGNTYAMFEKLCTLIGRPDIAPKYPTQPSRMEGVSEFDPSIEAWTQRFTTAECVEQLLAAGVSSGPIVPLNGYPREVNLEFRDMIRRAADPVSGGEVFLSASPLRMSRTPGLAGARIPPVDGDRAAAARIAARPIAAAGRTPGSTPRPPLEGVRILEFGQYTTAPLCTRELALLGAEVVKIEQPTGAEARTGEPVTFLMTNAHKKMIVVDLKNEFDIEAFRRLVATADVLVENLKPGTLAKFGFGPDALRAINPRLIYCPISGFGIDSLYPKRPAFDMIITAMAGFMTVLSSDGYPLKAGISIADLMGAQMAMVAILGALEHLDRSGEGQFVDLSMQDIAAWMTGTCWNDALEGRVEPAVVGVADGYVLVEAGEAVLDQALVDAKDGPIARDSLSGMTREALTSRLAGLGVEAVPVQTVNEAARMPHTLKRGLWFTMSDGGTDGPMMASPLRLTATPPCITRFAAPMDSDREALLAELKLDTRAVASSAT